MSQHFYKKKTAQEYSNFPPTFSTFLILSYSLTHSLSFLLLFILNFAAYMSLLLYLDGKEFDQKNSHIDLWWKAQNTQEKVNFSVCTRSSKGVQDVYKYIYIHFYVFLQYQKLHDFTNQTDNEGQFVFDENIK